MCLACEEEVFYRAYLDHMEKKAKENAAAEGAGERLAVCDDARERAQVGSTRLAHSKFAHAKSLTSEKPEISARDASAKQ